MTTTTDEDLELMVLGCLTIGPLTYEQVRHLLADQDPTQITRVLGELRVSERIVLLSSSRWALIHRT